MDAVAPPRASPFFHHPPKSAAGSFAILHLRRDTLFPLVLRAHDDADDGYREGKVVNTRFGSFPHSTLIGVPWGAQVRASAVDTGSRGRRPGGAAGLKRKRVLEAEDDAQTPDGSSPAGDVAAPPAAVAAASGFGHVLPPTPERWTSSLPHRTQLVYIPDYSYILHRLRARPGAVVLEAGSGSGSFTHAAARAAFNGYPTSPSDPARGRVWTFEVDPERATKLQEDLRAHALDSMVTVTHRDVYADGFQLPGALVRANLVFLDLPAPWRALAHLDRSRPDSPLDPTRTVHLCTFSPCIEQVQRTVAVLRARGWAEIAMVELAARRLEVRRERVGLQEEGLRGVSATPVDVAEAVGRLRELDARTRAAHEPMAEEQLVTKQERLRGIREALEQRKLYKEGRLVHRAEPELKTHTSYLVFAVLPMQWTEADEARVREEVAQWEGKQEPALQNKSKKQMKREARAAAKGST